MIFSPTPSSQRPEPTARQPFGKTCVERRSFQRIPLDGTVRYRVFSPAAGPKDETGRVMEDGQGRNLSPGGMLLETLNELERDAIISLAFSLPGLNRRIRTLAEVVRTSQDNGFQAGLRFLRMGLNDAIALMQYVNDFERRFPADRLPA